MNMHGEESPQRFTLDRFDRGGKEGRGERIVSTALTMHLHGQV